MSRCYEIWQVVLRSMQNGIVKPTDTLPNICSGLATVASSMSALPRRLASLHDPQKWSPILFCIMVSMAEVSK